MKREKPVSARFPSHAGIALLSLITAFASVRAFEGMLLARADENAGKAYVGEAPPDMALADTDVSPESARVILDGADIGEADDFDGYPGYLSLSPGQHTLEFRQKGYQTLVIELDARPGRKYDIHRKLFKGKPNEVRKESWVNPR